MALVTGGARRVGAAIVQKLHQAGYRVLIHYRGSQQAAEALAASLNAQRADSACCHGLDLLAYERLPELVQAALSRWGRLDALVNNASSYYPCTLENFTERDWEDLIGSNLRAPLHLCRTAAPHLRASRGVIVNITDIHVERPMPGYLLYNIAKAGLKALTESLAIDLAPEVRVNAVAPGAIMWPEDGQLEPAERERILAQIPLGREGGAEAIARAVHYLVCEAEYVTGQTIRVDGGRSLAL